jgi:LPXTG-motif cell wall-anchored protein
VATGIAIADQYANLGIVTGVGPDTTGVDANVVAGAVVTDEDMSHYFGTTPRSEEPPPGNLPSGGNPPVAGGALPVTGAQIGALPLAAGVALLAGALLVLLARRRRAGSVR